jgi:hypothetical protein
MWVFKKMEPHIDADKTRQKIKRLYVCSEQEARERISIFYTQIIGRILLVFAVTAFLVCITLIMKKMSSGAVVLKRDGYGGSVRTQTLEADIDGETTEFEVDVLPIEYESEELEEVFEKGFEYIESVYLGENESPDEVTQNLNLVEDIPELGLSVSWSSDDYSIISSAGEVKNESEDANGVVILTAEIVYGEESAIREYPVNVCARVQTSVEKAVNSIKTYIEKLQRQDDKNSEVELPESIEGYLVKKQGEANTGVVILFLGTVAALFVYFSSKSNLRKKETDMELELMLEYPELVDKLALYIGSGVTIRGSFTRICDSSQGILKKELTYMLNEIKSGIPESDAYYNMGHRINIPVYIKLMSMLSQNVKKGTKDLLAAMETEEQVALQARKELAKKRGEEAGTKLLFPMIVLMAIVMIIVVMPAILSF